MACNRKCQGTSRMPHKVTVQKPSTSNDSVGQETVTWVTHMSNASAEVKPLRAFEQLQANQAFGIHAYNVTMNRSRKTTAIGPDWRIIWHRGAHGDKTLNLSGPVSDLHPERKVRMTVAESV